MILRNLHHVGATVAGRELHHARAGRDADAAHGLGCRPATESVWFVAGKIRQIAAMQADGHLLSQAPAIANRAIE